MAVGYAHDLLFVTVVFLIETSPSEMTLNIKINNNNS